MNLHQVDSLTHYHERLIGLLADCVDDGASIGFLPPADQHELDVYWQTVNKALAQGERKIWLALDGDNLVGTVQLALCSKANGRHRGEVEKLMVAPSARRKGVSKQLMAALEAEAKALNLSLLVLDTREGDPASSLYRQLGFIEAGRIPDFALNGKGMLDATIYFYKQLSMAC